MKEIKLLHREAMEQTDLAFDARRKGDEAGALQYFQRAYELESKAALMVADNHAAEPTRSVLLRSAATLALDCNFVSEAERLICTALSGMPPIDIAEELRDLLENVYFQRHLALKGIVLSNNEIQMSMAGPSIGHGVAPTESFLKLVEKTENLLYRTAERKQNKPYRDRGRKSKDIQETVELFMSVPRAASFAVTFRVGNNIQPCFPGMSLGEEIVDEVLECLQLFNEGDESKLKERITEEAYYKNFVGLAQSIAPDGKEVSLVGFTSFREGKTRDIQLTSSRQDKKCDITTTKEEVTTLPNIEYEGSIKVIGTLKKADSVKKTKNTITIVDANGKKHLFVVPLGMMSDIVKPLWDTEVIATGSKEKNTITLNHISSY